MRSVNAPTTKLLLLLLVLLFAGSASAQNNSCSLKLADLPNAPELMGFRMGMSKDEVKALVPQVIFGKTDDFGVSKTSINPDFDARIDKAKFPGIRTVSLDFLDGRLTSLWLGYDGSFKWSTVPDYVKGISAALRLPDAWSEWKVRGQRLRCVDFQITLNIVSEGPSFRILDDVAERTIAERRAAKEEQDSEETEEATHEILADRKNKVYYPEECTTSKKIADADRVTFETREAAEAAGYKAARDCRPSPD